MEPEESFEKVQVQFDMMEIRNKFLKHASQTINAVKHTYHAVITYQESRIPPLETDSFPYKIDDQNDKNISLPTKEQTLLWIYKKAFEDFIVGLSEALILTYTQLKLMAISQSTSPENTISYEQYEQLLLEVNKEANSLSFPVLIDRIENELGETLPLKDEILSINKVRNCLVHRNGLVSTKDTNAKLDNLLILKYLHVQAKVYIDGKLVELNWEMRKNGFKTNRVELTKIKTNSNFALNERISLDHNQFNDIAFTCSFFTHDLLFHFHKKCMEEGFISTPLPPLEFTLGE
jgi:hypothetical protein